MAENVDKIKFNGKEIEVTRFLSIGKINSFCTNTIIRCFDNETGEYIAYIKDIVIRKGILEYYTNFEIPNDMDELYELLYSKDFEVIYQHIDMRQYKIIETAINEGIEFKKQEYIQSKNSMTEINRLIIGLLNKASEVMDNLKIDEIMKIVGDFNKNGGKITEDSIVNAFIKNLDKKSKPKSKSKAKSKAKEIKAVPEKPINE